MSSQLTWQDKTNFFKNESFSYMHEAGTVSPLFLILSQAKPWSLHLHTFVAWQSSDGVIRKMINMYMFTCIKRKYVSSWYITVQHHIGSSLRVWGVRESRILIGWADAGIYAILEWSFITVHNINKLSNTKCSLSISDNY